MSGGGGGDGVGVYLRYLTAPRVEYSVNLNSTIKDFRRAVSGKCAVRGDYLLLIFKGRIMTDDRTLKDYGVEEGDTIDLVEFLHAAVVNANATEEWAEDLVGNVGELDLSGLENLVKNPEALRILNMNNARMLAVCERSISVLNLLDLRLTILRNTNLESSSNPFTAGTSQAGSSGLQMVQTGLDPPLQTMLASHLWIRDLLQKSQLSLEAARTRDMLQGFPQIGQTTDMLRHFPQGLPSDRAGRGFQRSSECTPRNIPKMIELEQVACISNLRKDVNDPIRAEPTLIETIYHHN